jgi:hypothetical protein
LQTQTNSPALFDDESDRPAERIEFEKHPSNCSMVSTTIYTTKTENKTSINKKTKNNETDFTFSTSRTTYSPAVCPKNTRNKKMSVLQHCPNDNVFLASPVHTFTHQRIVLPLFPHTSRILSCSLQFLQLII